MLSKEIDWEEQWMHHAFDFRDGLAHVPLTPDLTMRLTPGPGFGDYSHPTTRLMLEMMTPFVAGKSVFDIGCGSGVLSVAAAMQNANPVFLCDLDPFAVAHALANGALNQVKLSNEKPKKADLVLMNMIASEQKIAWEQQHLPFSTLITSGILKEEKQTYLEFTRQFGWQLAKVFEAEDWLGFIFKEKSL